MGTTIKRRCFLKGLAATGAATLVSTPLRAQQKFAGRELVSQGFGGPTQDAIQAAVFDPFERRTGCKSTQVPLQSAAAFARMRAEATAPQIDMYQFSGGQERVAAAEKLTADLGNLANLAGVPANLRDANGQWVTYGVIAEGILYRTDKIAAAPRSYKDFLNPAYDGHIAFPTITNGYGTDFLVMLARADGGGEANIEPGFKAMGRFARNATIFKAAAEVPNLFAQADIWILPYDTATARRCRDAGLPVAFVTPQEGSPSVPCTTCIAAKSKNIDVARAVVDEFLSAEAQAAIAEKLQWAPTNTTFKLPEAIAGQIPHLDRLLQLDTSKIAAERSQWTERWNREIAHT